MNVITGFPRCGSTLLCNILNQNPKFYASSTSILVAALSNIQEYLSNSKQYRYELCRNRAHAEKKVFNGFNGLIDGYYYDKKEKKIFDKSRAWIYHTDFLDTLKPKNKKIILIRDLRNVIGSIEKQNRKTALFRSEVEYYEKKVFEGLFGSNGLVGYPMEGLQSFFDRNSRAAVIKSVPDIGGLYDDLETYNNIIIKYESLAKHPEMTLKIIYKFLQAEPFEHDFDDVKNTAEDPDGLYNYKFPHQGCGKVKEDNLTAYQNFMCPSISDKIKSRYQWFYEFFGYD